MLWAAVSGTNGMHALGSRVWHQGSQDEVGGAGIPVYTQAPANGTVQGRVPLSLQVSNVMCSGTGDTHFVQEEMAAP